MKKQNNLLMAHVVCWLGVGIFCLSVHAQKLPGVQQAPLRAPAHVKVDGKPAEWGNQFQAYNRATQIFYTMANDDEKLYLTVQTNDPNIISRIVGGGITLGIQKTVAKTDKGNINITYPVNEQTPFFNLRRKSLAGEDTTAKTADSIMRYNNMLIDKHCKWVKVKGVAGMDTLISVYNEDGIKAASLFNNKKTYTYELSVNLKLLNLSVNDAPKFAYHIRLNGVKSVFSLSVSGNAGSVEMADNLQEKLNTAGAEQSSSTDFWGEYILVK